MTATTQTTETKARKIVRTVTRWADAKGRVDRAFAAVDAKTVAPLGRATKAEMLEMERAVRALSRATAAWQALAQ
jgi:hypothetical protein